MKRLPLPSRSASSPGRRAAMSLSAGACALALLGGCTNAHYVKSADSAAYGLSQDRGAGVRNMDANFTIEQAATPSLDAFPSVAAVAAFLGEDGMSVRYLAAEYQNRRFKGRERLEFSSVKIGGARGTVCANLAVSAKI